MAWTTPKTDWVKSDHFTYADYNRIKNNLVYLNNLMNSLAPSKAVTIDLGDDLTYESGYSVETINKFEECIYGFKRVGIDVSVGDKKTWLGNNPFADYTDYNRWENCCLNWYNVSQTATGVSVTPSTVTLTTNGQKVQLTATVTPSSAYNKNVTWSSSDTSKVRVSNTGLLTCVNGCDSGSVVITCTTVDGGYTATCNVTVDIAVVSVTLPNPINIPNSETLKVTASYLPTNANITSSHWEISNSAVADFDTSQSTKAYERYIKGNSIGNTTLVCSLNGVSSTATLNVTSNVHVESVSISPSPIYCAVDETEQLTATVLPDNADIKTVTWSSSDTSVATVSSSGLVTSVGVGSAVITCTSDDNGVYATATVNVEEIVVFPFNKANSNSITFGHYYTGAYDESKGALSVVPYTNWNNCPCTQLLPYESGHAQAPIQTISFISTSTTKGTITFTCGNYKRNFLVNKVSGSSGYRIYCNNTFMSYASPYFDCFVRTGTTMQLYCRTLTATSNVTSSNTWYSSDESVCTVSSSGVVTGISQGSAIVAVKHGSVWATIQVEVFDVPTTVTIPTNTLSLKRGTNSLYSNAQLTPTNSNYGNRVLYGYSYTGGGITPRVENGGLYINVSSSSATLGTIALTIKFVTKSGIVTKTFNIETYD